MPETTNTNNSSVPLQTENSSGDVRNQPSDNVIIPISSGKQEEILQTSSNDETTSTKPKLPLLNQNEFAFQQFLEYGFEHLEGDHESLENALREWSKILNEEMSSSNLNEDNNELLTKYRTVTAAVIGFKDAEASLNKNGKISSDNHHAFYEAEIRFQRSIEKIVDDSSNNKQKAKKILQKFSEKINQLQTDKKITTDEKDELKLILTGFNQSLKKVTPQILSIFNQGLNDILDEIKNGKRFKKAEVPAVGQINQQPNRIQVFLFWLKVCFSWAVFSAISFFILYSFITPADTADLVDMIGTSILCGMVGAVVDVVT
jgi:hypothetical protein